MKKTLALVMALLLSVNLCSCAVMNQVIPTAEPEETVQPPAAEETPVPENTGSAEEPAPAAPVQSGNTSGNLLGGKMAKDPADGTLYVALDSGVYSLSADGVWTKLSEDCADDLNLSDGRLYYIARTGSLYAEVGDDTAAESIVSIAPDGSDRTVLLADAKVERVADLNWQNNAKATVTYRTGIADLSVYDGRLYFIADNENAGARTMYNPYEEVATVTTFMADKSICSMDVSGGEMTELVSGLGNGEAHMCIGSDGTIYYTTCYDSGWYPYDTVTFNRCALDGSGQTLLYGETDTSLEEAVREIVDGLMEADGQLYVLASDSEGDFPHARIMKVDGGSYTMIGEATYYVNPTEGTDGSLVYLMHEGDMQYHIDENGVYSDEYLEKVQLVRAWYDGSASDCDVLYEQENVLRFGDLFTNSSLAVFGSDLYLLTQDGVYHTDMEAPELVCIAQLPDLG